MDQDNSVPPVSLARKYTLDVDYASGIATVIPVPPVPPEEARPGLLLPPGAANNEVVS